MHNFGLIFYFVALLKYLQFQKRAYFPHNRLYRGQLLDFCLKQIASTHTIMAFFFFLYFQGDMQMLIK